jgi:hypothetical protein
MTTIRGRAILGVKIGILVAATLAAVAAAIYALAPPGPDDLEINLFTLIVFYFATGTVLGAVAGAAAPIARHWLGAAVLGVALAIPVAIVAQMILSGEFGFSSVSIVAAVVWSVVMGGTVGVGTWFHAKRNFPRWF